MIILEGLKNWEMEYFDWWYFNILIIYEYDNSEIFEL